jgi:hypothetical protein
MKTMKHKAVPIDKAPAFPNPETVREDLLNLAHIGANNNKYFWLKLEKASDGQWRLWTENGRVGAAKPQRRIYAQGHDRYTAETAYDQKLYEKTVKGDSNGNQYRKTQVAKAQAKAESSTAVIPITTNGLQIAPTSVLKGKDAYRAGIRAPSHWPDSARTIYDHLLQQTTCIVDAGTQVRSISAAGIDTPLGVLDDGALQAASGILKRLDFAIRRSDDYEIDRLNSEYYTIVPTKVGQKLIDSRIYSPIQVQEKQDFVQTARDAITGYQAASSSPQQTASRPILTMDEPTPQEISEIEKLIRSESHWSKGYAKLKNFKVWRVKREGDIDRYRFDIRNDQMLFHGTRTHTAVGILTRGLLCAKSAVASGGSFTYSAFGPGIYTASNFGKSHGYCTDTHNYTGSNTMFIVKTALGNSLRVEDANDYSRQKVDANGCPKGYHSVHGVKKGGRLPNGRKASYLEHDEYIVYNPAQTALAYMIVF